jgi:LPXTG-site transpeptidase (sortase) family protein
MNFDTTCIKIVAERIWNEKYVFFGLFFVFFLISYTVLVAIDFVPEPKIETESEIEDDSAPVNLIEQTAFEAEIPVATVEEPILPTSIYIKKLDRTIPVLNPDSRSVADLDAALLSGVVRHPDSAMLAQNGNVFILGHSSYLPTVMNKNFQAFNGIQNLAWGDTIEVSSGGKVHVFEVEKVFKAQASDLTVPIAGDERRLTLATCNSFGSTDDRFIVEAKEIEVRSL